MKLLLLILGILTYLLWTTHANASTKVGNGDDGSDLEGAALITEGPIFDSRNKAVDLLRRVNTEGIPHLGNLLPEVSKTNLYMTTKDSSATLPQDQARFHSDFSGLVYARTFARPYSATRFFPVSKSLNSDQLIALHIHEALHRSLPDNVREDESVVSQITLAITSPEATFDGVKQVVAKVVPENDIRLAPPPNVAYAPMGYPPPNTRIEEEHFKTPSNIGYVVKQYISDIKHLSTPIYQMHSLQSNLYPFGGVNTPFGLGIEGSVLLTDKGFIVGPLGISARLRVWSIRDFDIALWGSVALNMLSAEELKQSPFGRDVVTLGVSLRKDFKLAYVENYISYNAPGSQYETVGAVKGLHQYGEVINVKLRTGFRLWKFNLGGFGEVHLANNYAYFSDAYPEGLETGRYRIISAGPEVSFSTEDFTISAFGRIVADATNGANLDMLGNLMGVGVARGNFGLLVSVNF